VDGINIFILLLFILKILVNKLKWKDDKFLRR